MISTRLDELHPVSCPSCHKRAVQHWRQNLARRKLVNAPICLFKSCSWISGWQVETLFVVGLIAKVSFWRKSELGVSCFWCSEIIIYKWSFAEWKIINSFFLNKKFLQRDSISFFSLQASSGGLIVRGKEGRTQSTQIFFFSKVLIYDTRAWTCTEMCTQRLTFTARHNSSPSEIISVYLRKSLSLRPLCFVQGRGCQITGNTFC